MTDIKKEYHEHDKLAKLRDESQLIGEFLEVMQEKGVFLAHYRKVCKHYASHESYCRYLKDGTTLDFCEKCEDFEYSHEVMVSDNRSISDILANYFGIDQKKLEQEKKEMLQEFQELTGR